MYQVARNLFLLTLMAVRARTERRDILIAESDAQRVGDKFVSFSVDPEMLSEHTFTSSELDELHEMTHQLGPAFLQLSGPWCQKYHLERYAPANYSGPVVSEYYVRIGETVQMLAQTVQQAGFTLVVCLNPTLRNADGTWNATEAREILEILHLMEINIAVQLGHKRLENEPEVSGWQMGVDLVALYNLLQEFPRFRSALIISPDISPSLKLKDKVKFDQIFRTAGSRIDNVILHSSDFTPELGPGSENMGTTIDSAFTEMSVERWDIFNDLTLHKAAKKPLWISDAGKWKGRFVDAMVSISKLGHAAKSNVDVVLQKPTLRSFRRPTAEFWVSALHKRLVGQTVLDVSFVEHREFGDETHLFAHCSPQGGVTLFGANYRPKPVSLRVKDVGVDTEINVFSLTPRKKNIFSRMVLLNRQRPNVSSEWMQPLVLAPQSNDSVVMLHMPSTSIVFWHMPHAQFDACLTHQGESQEIWPRDTSLALKDEEELLEETEMKQNCTAHEPSYSTFLRRFIRFLKAEDSGEGIRTKRAAPDRLQPYNNKFLQRSSRKLNPEKRQIADFLMGAGAKFRHWAWTVGKIFGHQTRSRKGRFQARKSMPKRMVHHLSKSQRYADAWPKVAPLRALSGHRIIGRKLDNQKSEKSTEITTKKESEGVEIGRVKRQGDNDLYEFQFLNEEDLNNLPEYQPSSLTESQKMEKLHSINKFFRSMSDILSSIRRKVVSVSAPNLNVLNATDTKNNN
ncbi:uncharacterized protein LOC135940829 [Cloeon dipterum]|uniref:uncharacterized protein LOC135940829 n=1 Tax=Cloeon dipterum TaxID=197152 RepID=UPI0032203794